MAQDLEDGEVFMMKGSAKDPYVLKRVGTTLLLLSCLFLSGCGYIEMGFMDISYFVTHGKTYNQELREREDKSEKQKEWYRQHAESIRILEITHKKISGKRRLIYTIVNDSNYPIGYVRFIITYLDSGGYRLDSYIIDIEGEHYLGCAHDGMPIQPHTKVISDNDSYDLTEWRLSKYNPTSFNIIATVAGKEIMNCYYLIK
jgi:hypothetical protein